MLQVSLLRPGIPVADPKWKHHPILCHPEEPVTFSIFSCLRIQSAVFQTPDKAVILSEALRRSIANRGLYGAESKDPGDACWQMLLGAFRPQTTTEDKKSQTPSVPGFPTSPLSPATTYVVLPKETHMQLTEAATLDRKSGEAEG